MILSRTAAQAVTFLWRAAGSPDGARAGGFTDISADSYYAEAVAWAVENGITVGTGSSLFLPDAACTRAQAVTLLYRANGSPAVSGNTTFSDVAADAYYASAVMWAAENGISNGLGRVSHLDLIRFLVDQDTKKRAVPSAPSVFRCRFEVKRLENKAFY